MWAGWRMGATSRNSTSPWEEKKNASKLVALQNLNEELLSVAEEQHQQLDACV